MSPASCTEGWTLRGASGTEQTAELQLGKPKIFSSCNLWDRIATYIYEDSNCCHGVILTPTAEVTINGDDS
jgi:hypothetical protein